MAYDASADQSQDDEQQQSQANQPAGQPATQLSGGGGGFAGQGGAPQAGNGTPGSLNQQPTNSGSWTNLNSYLDQNADQSGAIGSQIANTVGGQAQTAQSDLGQVQQGFQNQPPYAAINGTTPQGVDSAFTNPGQYAGANATSTAQPETYLNNSWGITPQNSDITQYGAATTNADGTSTPSTVTGPNWGTVQNDYATAGQSLQDTQSESGRDLLLQNQYGQNGSQYSPGEQSFDQLLLQQNPGNQQALNSVYQQYNPAVGVPSAANASATNGQPLDLYNAEQASQAYITAEQAKASGFQTQAAGDLSSDISGLGTAVGNETTAANAGYTSTYDQFSRDLASGHLNPAEEAALGISGPLDTYGVNASQYLDPAATNPYTANSAATTGDWSSLAGLQNLVGGYSGTGQATDNSALANVGLTGTQASQASAPPPASPYSAFELSNFNQAVGQAATLYGNGMNSVQSTLSATPSLPQGWGGGSSVPSPPQNATTAQLAAYWNNVLQDPQVQAQETGNPAWANIQSALSQYNQLQGQNTYLDGAYNVAPKLAGRA